MVTITNCETRENSSGESFTILIVSGGLESAKSKQTGKTYFTTRKASVPCTFDESVANSMIGQQINGEVKKVPCEPYTFLTENEEEIELDFTYEFSEETENIVETVLG